MPAQDAAPEHSLYSILSSPKQIYTNAARDWTSACRTDALFPLLPATCPPLRRHRHG